MSIIDQINQMKEQGLDESQIIQQLKEQGLRPTQIQAICLVPVPAIMSLHQGPGTIKSHGKPQMAIWLGVL